MPCIVWSAGLFPPAFPHVPFDVIPDPVQLGQRARIHRLAGSTDSVFHRLESADELFDIIIEHFFGMQVLEPAEIDHREE